MWLLRQINFLSYLSGHCHLFGEQTSMRGTSIRLKKQQIDKTEQKVGSQFLTFKKAISNKWYDHDKHIPPG